MEGLEGGKAADRYDTFDAVRNLFGGARKTSGQETLAPRNKDRRKSKSDPRSLVKAPVPLAEDKNEDALASERISQAKELAVIMESKKIAEENRIAELKGRGERPLSASTGKRPSQQQSELYSLLMIKANSVTSLASDKGYGTSSPKPSNGSMSPRGGSETNLLDESLGSETISDMASKDPPLLAWQDSPDHRQPLRFVRSKHLPPNEEDFNEETPQLRHLREVVETLESKAVDADMLRPGYCPQSTAKGRVTGEVRVPVPDSKYKDFASGDEELEDDPTWDQNVQKLKPGKFVKLEPKPQPKTSSPTFPDASEGRVNLKTTPPQTDSGSDDCYTPDLPRSKASVRRAHSTSALTLHQYMMKLQARKQRLSHEGNPVDSGGEGSPQIPREKNPHQVLEDDDVMRRSMQWDDTIGKWVFAGKIQPYSPQMDSKREKRRSRQIHIPAPDSAYQPFLNEDQNDSSWEQDHSNVTMGKFVVRDSPSTSCDTLPGNESTDGLEETPAPDSSSSQTETTKTTATIKEENTQQQPSGENSRTLHTGEKKTAKEDESDEEEGIAVAKQIQEKARLFGGVSLRRAKSFSAKHSVSRAMARKKATVDDSDVNTRRGSDSSSPDITPPAPQPSTGRKSSGFGKFHQSISIKIASLRK